MTRIFLDIIIMLVAANGAPVLVGYLRGWREARPVDGGRTLSDGRPLFGSSKTWRGVIAIVAAAAAAAILLGYGIAFGLLFGALVVAGDLFSSFVKRRRGLPPSSRATGLDQLPESLLPAAYAVAHLELTWWWAPLLAMAFMLLEIVVSKPLFYLHIRKRPY